MAMSQEERALEDQKWLNGLADRRKQELSELRWKHETGGALVQVDGIEHPLRINTSTESQSKIATARLLAKEDNSRVFGWKTLDGFVQLTAAQMIEVSDGVIAHIEACFVREAELLAQIEAAPSPSDIQTIVFDGWPVSSIYEE